MKEIELKKEELYLVEIYRFCQDNKLTFKYTHHYNEIKFEIAGGGFSYNSYTMNDLDNIKLKFSKFKEDVYRFREGDRVVCFSETMTSNWVYTIKKIYEDTFEALIETDCEYEQYRSLVVKFYTLKPFPIVETKKK